MDGLLPSTPDVDPSDEPRVVGLDSDAADELIDALSSATTRRILAALHEEPAAASQLADRVDTSLQNVQYHLGKLEEADLVEVGDTVYSEKGREMNVYVPADRALVVVAGREEETTGLKAALSRLLGGIGVLGLASVVVDRLARRGGPVGFGAAGGAGDRADGGGAPDGEGGAAPTTETASAADTGGGGGTTKTEAATATETPGPPTATDAVEAATTTTAPAGTSTPQATAEQTATATEAPVSTVAATETPAPTPTEVTTGTPTEVATRAVETAAGAQPQPSFVDGVTASPGLLFFLGGATVLVGGFALWWATR